jgi:ADP-ribose pyrophosphatase
VKVRLVGLPDEVAHAAEAIGQVLQVVEQSPPVPRRNNSRLVSVYLDVRLTGSPVCPPGR